MHELHEVSCLLQKKFVMTFNFSFFIKNLRKLRGNAYKWKCTKRRVMLHCPLTPTLYFFWHQHWYRSTVRTNDENRWYSENKLHRQKSSLNCFLRVLSNTRKDLIWWCDSGNCSKNVTLVFLLGWNQRESWVNSFRITFRQAQHFYFTFQQPTAFRISMAYVHTGLFVSFNCLFLTSQKVAGRADCPNPSSFWRGFSELFKEHHVEDALCPGNAINENMAAEGSQNDDPCVAPIDVGMLEFRL